MLLKVRKKLVLCFLFLVSFFTSHAQTNLRIAQLPLDPVEKEVFSDEVAQATHDKNKFVKLVSIGQALCLARKYSESNEYFERAYLLITDQHYHRMKPKYELYDDTHELFMVLYFKAINYLELGDVENAVVEGRRVVELMRPLNATDVDRRMIAADPFAQSILGILYSLDQEFDDARIAFDAAISLYEKEYEGLSSKTVPQWILDRDIELKNKMGSTSTPENRKPAGHLIFIWHNGEYPLNHLHSDFKVIRHGQDFVSNDVSVMIGEDSFGNFRLPFIEFRDPVYSSKGLQCNGKSFPCEVLSFASWYSMKMNTFRLEHSGIHVWRHGINWATLPAQIYWSVVPLKPGNNRIDFRMTDGKELRDVNFEVKGDNQTHVYLLTTLESKTELKPSNLAPVDYLIGGAPIPKNLNLTLSSTR